MVGNRGDVGSIINQTIKHNIQITLNTLHTINNDTIQS